MKTNIIMKRQLDVFHIEQRTKDGWFNATDLLRKWNENVEKQRSLNTQKNRELKNKDLDDFFNNKNTKEFVEHIRIKEQINDVYKSTRGRYGGTWMHPLLFVDFAMWLNVEFKYEVLKFVRDNMIEFRNRAGDSYKKLADAVYRVVDKDFMLVAMSRIAEGINYVVFDNHYKDIRNQYGDETKMEELFQLEEQVAFLIENDYEKSVEGIIKFLRRKYEQKYG